MMQRILDGLLWWIPLVAILVGIATLRFPVGVALAVAGAGLLAIRGIARHPDPRIAVGVGVGILGSAGLTLVSSGPLHVACIALAAQLVLIGLSRPAPVASARRWALPLVGHATVLFGSLLILRGASDGAVAIAYASGLSVLALHAHWTQRGGSARGVDGWEIGLMLAIFAGVMAASVAFVSRTRAFSLLLPLADVAVYVGTVAGIACLAILASPPPMVAMERARAGPTAVVLAHGGAAMALLNATLLVLALTSSWSLKVVFGLLLVWQLGVIIMEYRTVRHAERRRAGRFGLAPHAGSLDGLVTVIVPACGEASVLRETLRANLALAHELRFILVPAASSKDDTVDICLDAQRAQPSRVRVVLGTGGSKAQDLNLAWSSVETPYALLLDADETIDERSLRRAIGVLATRPDVGIVQGRKVSTHPDASALARFISAERRYSTWMDHVMHGDTLGSAHFGGSAALVRREVPSTVGGWSEATMTEDIEFTLRIHLDRTWDIVYAPDVVVREADPADFGQLLRQRTRWSRGWMQCFGIFFRRIIDERKSLGRTRAFGLGWLLLISVSAVWTVFFPATLALRLLGVSLLLPVAVAFGLTLVLLPARLIAYFYAGLRDPVIPMRATPGRILELAFHAYLWILVGWLVQLHALYLELSSAPRTWHVTGKRHGAKA